MTDSVTATEFQTRAGQYIESSAKKPVYITKHGRPVRVLIDVDEYNRLKEMEAEMDKRLIEKRLDTHRETLDKLALR